LVRELTLKYLCIVKKTCFYATEKKLSSTWLTLDYVCDLFYVLSSFTGFLEQGIQVRDLSLLKTRYLRSSRFKWDIEALDHMETRTSYPNTFRVAKLMLYIFVVIHWNACVYFSPSNYIGFGADPWVYPNISDPDFAFTRRQYFLTTVGDTPPPELEEEYLFLVADMLIAVLVFASVVGSMGDVIQACVIVTACFFPNHEMHNLIGSIICQNTGCKRVNDWYNHLHINKKITWENEILQHLPITLQTAIAMSVHLPALSKVTIFQNCENSLLEQLVLKLTPQVYSPGEYVCKKGDVGHKMYIIKEGKLAVVTDDGVTQFAVLGEGNSFGEISILNIKGNKSGNRRTANIRSIGYSDLFSLSKEGLTETLLEYPAAKCLLEEKGHQILTKMGMLEETDEGKGQVEKTEDKVKRIEANLEALQTKLAWLLAELESSARKMMQRVEQLGLQTEGWEGIVAEGAQGEIEEGEKVKEREIGDGEGKKEDEEDPVVEEERGEGNGGEGSLGEKEKNVGGNEKN
uniref:Cyclic nucleotide gated channel subunit alpha 4 n=1 Tax=Sinocyclocheilus anshuiensis TaxID=1608454 RepID=A0A671LXW1_9TELE